MILYGFHILQIGPRFEYIHIVHDTKTQGLKFEYKNIFKHSIDYFKEIE